MDQPLDPFILSLAEGQQVGLIRGFFRIALLISAIGFVFFWFAAMRIWLSGVNDTWRDKGSFFALSSVHNSFGREFRKIAFKGILILSISLWPFLFIVTGLVSMDAMNTLLGYEVASSSE